MTHDINHNADASVSCYKYKKRINNFQAKSKKKTNNHNF